MSGLERRLNGWKAIAGFFGRDRTTVARWAKERGLPIHQIPGGKQKSVFAFEHELETWRSRYAEGELGEALTPEPALAPEPEIVAEPAPVPTTPPSPVARRRMPRWVWAASLVSAATLVGGVAYFRPTLLGGSQAPASVMADYIAARDIWARRTPADIRDAIQRYEKIIREAPDFALARAGLAEAWLIYREYGDVSDARAFGIARIAAQKALAIDPNLAAGHRAIGFIDYWWDNDPAGAVKAFQRAIQLDETDAQSHFWYANVLADLGEHDAAERHYARARLLAPGSQAIAVEHACAQWQAGRDALALKMMTELKARYPVDATISNCLTWLHMGRGDIRAFAAEYARMAKLRGEPEVMRLSDALAAAVARDPATAHRVLIEDSRRELAAGTRRIREVPAFYASSMGDRAELVKLMREAEVLGERWYSPAVTARIAARWRGDTEIQSLLAELRVAPPRLPGL